MADKSVSSGSLRGSSILSPMALCSSEPDFDVDIKEDVQEECSKYGTLKHIFVDKCGTAAAFAQEIHQFFGDRISVINY